MDEKQNNNISMLQRDALSAGFMSGILVSLVYVLTIDLETFVSFVFPGLLYGIVSSFLIYKYISKHIVRLVLWTLACVGSFLSAFLSCVLFVGTSGKLEWWMLSTASVLGSLILLVAFSLLFRKPGLLNSLKVVLIPTLAAFVSGWMMDPSHSVGGETLPFLFLFVPWQTIVTVFLCADPKNKERRMTPVEYVRSIGKAINYYWSHGPN